jgi:hypothetical protein
MNERIRELAEQAGLSHMPSNYPDMADLYKGADYELAKFAELIVRECIDKIETYRIPVGNSRSGELACEWTYNALRDIRDEIKENFGIH